MRSKSFTPPKGWAERAEAAFKEVESEDVGNRSDAVNRNADVWAELKEPLASLSDHKCWYCETQYERSDYDVDHFRPKNRIARNSKHDGYWWLAFDWTNYRFSCVYCNRRRKDKELGRSGGKGDHFPLWSEASRAYRPRDSIESEDPCLLDPTVATDPRLLWFNDEGHAVPACPDDERQNSRADKSIELYHLNYFPTTMQRLLLYRKIRRLTSKGNWCFERLLSATTAMEGELAEEMLALIVEELINAISPRTQHSAAAKAYLRGFKDSEHEWIAHLIQED